MKCDKWSQLQFLCSSSLSPHDVTIVLLLLVLSCLTSLTLFLFLNSSLVVEFTETSVVSAFSPTPPPFAPSTIAPTTISTSTPTAVTSTMPTTLPPTTNTTTSITSSPTTRAMAPSPSSSSSTSAAEVTTPTARPVVTTSRTTQRVLGTCSIVVFHLTFWIWKYEWLPSPSWRIRTQHYGCILISCASCNKSGELLQNIRM